MIEIYADVCVLRRCGQLDGNEACCKRMKRMSKDEQIMGLEKLKTDHEAEILSLKIEKNTPVVE